MPRDWKKVLTDEVDKLLAENARLRHALLEIADNPYLITGPEAQEIAQKALDAEEP